MFKNQFFRTLFDYRGTITRRQYWASLLFLSLLLSLSNLSFRWEQISSLLGVRVARIQEYSLDVYMFLLYIFNAITAILYFSPIAVAVSLIVVTLKRSRTLGYSSLKCWFCGIITYLCYFLINGYANYIQFYLADRYINRSGIGDESLQSVIPVITVFIGLIVLCTIVIVILLSRQEDIDYEEVVDYDGYDSASSIFGLFKFSLSVIAAVFLIKFVIPLISLSRAFISLSSLLLVLLFIIFYLRIFVKRSRDAKVSSAYIIGGFLALIGLITGYFVLSHNHFF